MTSAAIYCSDQSCLLFSIAQVWYISNWLLLTWNVHYFTLHIVRRPFNLQWYNLDPPHPPQSILFVPLVHKTILLCWLEKSTYPVQAHSRLENTILRNFPVSILYQTYARKLTRTCYITNTIEFYITVFLTWLFTYYDYQLSTARKSLVK